MSSSELKTINFQNMTNDNKQQKLSMQKYMSEQLTIKKARSHRFWLGGVICRLFHHIRTIEECKFIDRVDGREVGQYECCRCNKRFMANSKRSWFRVYS